MALIKCPECGKEVSDTAENCPNCGYNMQKYLKSKRIEEQQKKAEKELQERELKKQEKKKLYKEKVRQWYDKYLGTKRKKIKFSCICIISLAVILGFGAWNYKRTENLRNARYFVISSIEDLNDVEDDLYEYYEIGEDKFYKLNRYSLSTLEFSITTARELYNILNSDEKNLLDSYMNDKFKMTWNELDERCDELGITARTKEEYLRHRDNDGYYDRRIKRLYDKYEEEVGSVFVESSSVNHSHGQHLISGSVKNTTDKTVYFVKVKVRICDSDRNVLNVDSTYAVGDEGLKPNESVVFKCYTDWADGAKDYIAEVYDYQY